jgi:hypothetical protein
VVAICVPRLQIKGSTSKISFLCACSNHMNALPQCRLPLSVFRLSYRGL